MIVTSNESMVAQKAQRLTIHAYCGTIRRINPEPGVWTYRSAPMAQKQPTDDQIRQMSKLAESRPAAAVKSNKLYIEPVGKLMKKARKKAAKRTSKRPITKQ